jgi:hypothetical protein
VIAYDAEVPSAILERARADAGRMLLTANGQLPRCDGLIVVLRSR